MSESALVGSTAPLAHVAAPPVVRPAQGAPSSPAAEATTIRRRLDLPLPAQPMRLRWDYVAPLVILHSLSLLACIPWLFSWTGVVLCLGGIPFYGTFGVTLCYHRLLTHQGLTLPKWLEHACAILGVCTLQDTPARWVAIHRMHHKHADQQEDPHSPLVNFFWSHVGWVVVLHREHSPVRFYEQYAKDVLRDPFYLRLERGGLWMWTYIAHAVLYLVVGIAVGWLMTGRLVGGLQFGASVLVWGVFLRTVLNWHGTWIVNSITHIWGYRNYDTPDHSTNHWLVSLIANGEGWHNNHHADQRAAAHGHRWWEFDLTYRVICVLEWLGLAKDVVRPRVWTKREAPAEGAERVIGAPHVTFSESPGPAPSPPSRLPLTK